MVTVAATGDRGVCDRGMGKGLRRWDWLGLLRFSLYWAAVSKPTGLGQRCFGLGSGLGLSKFGLMGYWAEAWLGKKGIGFRHNGP